MYMKLPGKEEKKEKKTAEKVPERLMEVGVMKAEVRYRKRWRQTVCC